MALEMHNPFRDKGDVRPAPPPRSLNPKDLAKVYIMAVLLVFILLAMILAMVFVKKGRATAAPLGKDEIRYSIRPADDPLANRARELASALKDDAAEPDVDAEPFLRLLDFMRADITPDGVSSRARRVPPVLLATESAKRRGAFVLLAGRPENVAARDLKRKAGDRVGVGTLVTQPGHVSVRFVSTDVLLPADADEGWELEGAFARLVGETPLIVARNVRLTPRPAGHQEQPAPPRAAATGQSVRELAQAFKDDKDSIGVSVDKSSPEFRAMMSAILTGVTREDASKAVKPDIKPGDLLADPARHRGETVVVYGRLVNLSAERLDFTTPENITEVYWASLHAHPSGVPIHFYMVDRPPPIQTYMHRGQLLARDWVEIEGVFLRLYRYEGKTFDGTQGPERIAPVLFVKNMRIADAPTFKDPRGGFVLMVLGLGGILAVIVIVAGVMARRYGRSTMRRRMVEVRRQKAAAEGKPLFPPAPSGRQVLGDEIKPSASPTTTTTEPPPAPPGT